MALARGQDLCFLETQQVKHTGQRTGLKIRFRSGSELKWGNTVAGYPSGFQHFNLPIGKSGNESRIAVLIGYDSSKIRDFSEEERRLESNLGGVGKAVDILRTFDHSLLEGRLPGVGLRDSPFEVNPITGEEHLVNIVLTHSGLCGEAYVGAGSRLVDPSGA